MRRRKKAAEREVARDRIVRLIELADARQRDRSDLADRYVRLARRIGMRYQVSLPADVRRRVCRGCDGLLVPGRTARVRLTAGRVSITCLRCQTVKRFPVRKGAAPVVRIEEVAA